MIRIKILIINMLLILTAFNLLANPFASLAKSKYTGYFLSDQMSMIIMEFDGEFTGAIKYSGVEYLFSAKLKSGVLKGELGDNKKFPFTAKISSKQLNFKSANFSSVMTKELGKFDAGQYCSNTVSININKIAENNYSGELILKGDTFELKGKSCGPLFYGRFFLDGNSYPFYILKDKFHTADYSCQLKKKVKLYSNSYFELLTDRGKKCYENGFGILLAYVAPGTFKMGYKGCASNEQPVHEVTITKPFLIGKYEITQSEYKTIMGNNPSYFEKSSNPVEMVSWNDAVEFCRVLTKKEQENGALKQGYIYRLPTEAEWEYAARGGQKSKGYNHSGSSSINSVAWYKGNSEGKTHPVGQKKQNELGLHDMNGNVWEWCSDWFAYYDYGSAVDPKGPSTTAAHVYRGGGYYCYAGYCRVSNRNHSSPDTTNSYLGFRVVLAAE